MQRDYERYLKLKRAIQDWIIGQGTLMPVAHILNITTSSLEELLDWNGLHSDKGTPDCTTDVQDVFNLLFLTYSLANRDAIRRRGFKK